MKLTPQKLGTTTLYAIAFVVMSHLAASAPPIDGENSFADRSRGPPKTASDGIVPADMFPYPAVGRFRGH